MKDFNENQQEKGTSLIKSMPQSAQNDTYLGNNFCKNTKKSIKNVSFLRKPRVFKVIAASGLAFFMGVGTLCGVLIAPMGATSAPNAGNLASAAQSADSAPNQGLISPHEDDPVLFTTESGLDVKYGNALTGNLAGFPYLVTNDGTTDYYWVIIGCVSTSMLADVQDQAIPEKSTFEKDSPAGEAIGNDNLFHKFYASGMKGVANNLLYSKGLNSELYEGQVLCLANSSVASGEKNTSAKPTGNYDIKNCYSTYEGTMADTLDTYLTLFGLSEISNYMVNVQLNSTGMRQNQLVTLPSTHKIFTLSGVSTDTFYYLNYLTETQAADQEWWLRGAQWSTPTSSGQSVNYYTDYYYYGQYVNLNGGISTATVNTSYGYRPAFVLQL